MLGRFVAKRGKPQGEIAELAVEKKKRFFDLPHPACEIEINFDKVNDMDDLVARRNTTGEIEMYTDGSKIGGKVGAALTYWKNDKEIGKKKFLLATQCTVYQAELYALYQATEIAAKLKDTVINIYSDSRSSLETISNIHTYHPLAFEIRKTLTKLKLNNKIVKLFWIKAHVGVEGNERADQLAKEAALTKKTAPDYDACPCLFTRAASATDDCSRRPFGGSQWGSTAVGDRRRPLLRVDCNSSRRRHRLLPRRRRLQSTPVACR
ncbi:uncharacterized protein LOC128198193 [Bicyclus anynana]|uniref:ribonuclease H n=1 Tax=Bicyclus anynana TaxID=110368 RepID=A0ABM3LGG3_BICAN|nr:uncharacterized protein LOC128198193 [Bicyclus anynana]